jgi:HAD superfamily hydrolase (TIGR01490 family)
VAAFDFDGTLSSRDNFVPFLRRVAGTGTATGAFVRSAARLGLAGRARWSRNEMKARVLDRLFAGRDTAEVDAIGLDFANEVLARHLRDEAVQRAEWHRTQGHHLVIVSASLGAYLRPVGEGLGFDAVLATELEHGPDGRLTGRMLGENVRGPEKARRLVAWLDGSTPFVWAYGDSSGDRELWAHADRAVRLGRRAHRGTG